MLKGIIKKYLVNLVLDLLQDEGKKYVESTKNEIDNLVYQFLVNLLLSLKK